MSKKTVAKCPLKDVQAHLKGYKAVRHQDVSTNLGQVFFSAPMQKWILVQVKKSDPNTAILEFSDDCPCSKMGAKY